MTVPRPLTRDQHQAFRLARLVAVELAPYFAHALFAVTPLADDDLGTFGVDRHWRLYMDPALLHGPTAWPPHIAGGVLLHEVGHLLREHAARAAQLPDQPYRHLDWNLAGDAEINDDLLVAGVALPDGVVTPAALGCDDNGLAEDYYAALTPPPGTAPNGADSNDDGGVGCGSGAGCPPLPGELPPSTPTAPGLDPAEADFVRRRVAADVVAHAAAKGRGSVPAGLTRWADAVLAPPTVRWETVLRAAVRRAVANRAGRTDYSYARPARRQVPGIVKPAMRGHEVTVSIVIDTSGSMTTADLDAAMAELRGVLRTSGVAAHATRVIACDAAAATAQRVRDVRDVVLTGGGGTDMRIGITAAHDARPTPDVVIVLTDGDTDWPDHPTRARLICAVIAHHEPHGTPAWATTVHIPPAA